MGGGCYCLFQIHQDRRQSEVTPVPRVHPLWLSVAGGILCAPSMWFWFCPRASLHDVAKTQSPLATWPMPVLRVGDRHRFEVIPPEGPSWRRIRRQWGDPRYLIIARAISGREILCFDRLGLRVNVDVGGKPVATESIEYPPYGFSGNCKCYGIAFTPQGRMPASIVVSTTTAVRLSDGELVVLAHWGPDMKDRFVSVHLDETVTRLSNILAMAGVGILICGICGSVIGRLRHKGVKYE